VALGRQEKHEEAHRVLERVTLRAREFLKAHPDDFRLKNVVARAFLDLAMTLIDLGDHARAARAIKDMPLPAAVDPERKTSVNLEQRRTADLAQAFFGVGQLLARCASLAERDATLSPSERANAVQTYAAQAKSWYEKAARTAEDWARNHMAGSVNLGRVVSALSESLIQNDYSTAHPEWARQVKVEADFLLIKALIQAAIHQSPDDPTQYLIADVLSSAPEGLRDPQLALKLARRAVELKPGDGLCQQSLGWALYRVGDWEGCISTIAKQTNQRESVFVLAMAHWHLGKKDEARAEFDRGSEWLKGYEKRCEERQKEGTLIHTPPSMLKRLRAEAAALLGFELPSEVAKPKTG
jgi:tetratricopeptide (TPR) repeat protein